MRRSDGRPYWHRRRCEHDDEDLVDEEGGAREGRVEQERLHRLAQHVPLGEERRERRARHEHVDDRGGEHEHKQEQPLRRVEAAVARLQVARLDPGTRVQIWSITEVPKGETKVPRAQVEVASPLRTFGRCFWPLLLVVAFGVCVHSSF